MTKKEFETTEEPLVMIVSLDPETGKILHDTYDYDMADGWMVHIKKDFPDMIHFRITNPAGIKVRMQNLGLKTMNRK